MKKYLILLVFVPFLMVGCNQAELDRLKAQNDSLQNVTGTSDLKINDFVKSFNEIQENLNQIKEKEKILSVQSNNEQLSENQKDQINQDILAIYELMLKNKQKVEQLEKKLRKSNTKNAELEKAVKLYTAQLAEKDKEITILKEQMAKLNIDIANLNEKITEMANNMDTMAQVNEEKTELINKQDEELNTRYYVYGSKKELIANKILDKDGLFKSKLSDNFDKNYFTKIDLRKTTSISLNCKEATIMTSHPAGSYSFEKSGKIIDKIQISETEKFWENSKFLVIVVE